MKAEDLRIGNWVMGNKPLQLTFNDFGRIHAHLMATGQMRFEPIPLTEDWLVRFGFEKIRDESRKQNYQTLDKLLLFDDSGNTLHAYSDREDVMIYHEQYKYLNGYGLRTDIEFVHQLQNLYHALTGKELELNTEK